MELTEALARRHMVRSFSDRPLDASLVDRVLAGALGAPSAGNCGGWSLVVLDTPAARDRFWEATTTASWRSSSRRWPGLSRAPVVAAVLAEPGAYLERYSEPDKRRSGLGDDESAWPVPYWFVDAGMAVMAILLSAAAEGLGACFLGNFRGERPLLEALGIPPSDRRRYAGAVLLGYPDSADVASPSAVRGRRDPQRVVRRLAPPLGDTSHEPT